MIHLCSFVQPTIFLISKVDWFSISINLRESQFMKSSGHKQALDTWGRNLGAWWSCFVFVELQIKDTEKRAGKDAAQKILSGLITLIIKRMKIRDGSLLTGGTRVFAGSVSAPSWQTSPLLLYPLLFYFKLSLLISSHCPKPVPGERLLPALTRSVVYSCFPKHQGCSGM